MRWKPLSMMGALRRRAAAVSIYVALHSLPAIAETINFDDLTPNHNANFGPNFAIPPDNYHGFTWLNTVVEPASTFIPGSLNLNVSAPNVATDVNYLGYSLNAAPIQFSSVNSFEFQTAYFIANQQDVKVTVNGLRDGLIVDTQTLSVGTSAPVLGTFNWKNVDTVIMMGHDGTDPTKHQSFTFDNVRAVPEPETWAMALVAIGVIVFFVRGRPASSVRATPTGLC